MQDPPKSKQFDDVYFSVEDGLAETHHVFLDGNDLPDAWSGQARFVICETGFGTGLNFLSAWKLFEESADTDQKLDFISVEKYPLEGDFIQASLAHWSDVFEGRLEHLVEHYPMRVPGFHRIQITDRVTLTLIFDDINHALPVLDARVNCWFLDGFKPSSNPDMWSDILFREMARLSLSEASFATFTAAGDVKRGLQGAGFDVQKVTGFGRKREMLIGRFGS